MKTFAHVVPKAIFCTLLIAVLHHIPAMAQDKAGSTKLIIIKEHTDADGNKTVERIEKEGEEAKNFDMETLSPGHNFGEPNIRWKKFDFKGEDMPDMEGFENFKGFEGQMPDMSKFFDFESLFGDELGLEGFSWSYGGGSDKPRLGVQIQSLETQDGVLIASIQQGSVAEEIGLKTGDVILSVDGESVLEPDQLAEIIRSHELGDKVSLDILRDDEHLIFEAQLGTPKEKEIKTRKI